MSIDKENKLDISEKINVKNYKKLSPKVLNQLFEHIIYSQAQEYKIPFIYFLKEPKVIITAIVILIYMHFFNNSEDVDIFTSFTKSLFYTVVIVVIWYKSFDSKRKSDALWVINNLLYIINKTY